MAKILMIDPPSGWKYGFPKQIPAEHRKTGESVIPWLVANGYPQREVDSLGKHFYVRYWEEEVNEE